MTHFGCKTFINILDIHCDEYPLGLDEMKELVMKLKHLIPSFLEESTHQYDLILPPIHYSYGVPLEPNREVELIIQPYNLSSSSDYGSASNSSAIHPHVLNAQCQVLEIDRHLEKTIFKPPKKYG